MNQPSWIGHVLSGRYTLEALLGQGGMSAVYRASDSNLKRAVAVKLIHNHLTHDPEFVRRFETEAAACATLRHPNIIQVFDFAQDNGTYYMVLELLPGESLDRRLKRLAAEGKRFPVDQAAKIIASVAGAVDYAHQRGLIHRDIKPANIMLTERGQAVLMDFGVAKIVGGTQHTATGMVIGTANYISPEMVRGKPPSPQSDIYALGASLFEMLAGSPPFKGDSAMGVMLAHVNEPVPDLRQIAPETPSNIIAVVEKSLAKDPQDRYNSASEMAAALGPAKGARSRTGTLLKRALGVSPPAVTTGGGGPVEPVAGNAQARPYLAGIIGGVLGLGALCVCLGLAGGLFALSQYNQARTASAPPPPTVTPAPVASASASALPSEPAVTETLFAPATSTLPPVPSATLAPPVTIPPGMVLIPAGSFQMGSASGPGEERPPHAVSLDVFYLDVLEVTNSDYAKCVADGACLAPANRGSFTRGTYFSNPAFASFPVSSVKWAQAGTYCQWNGGKRLPTEAEWEYAATGGDGRKFPWGDTFELNRLPAQESDTTAVGSYPTGASPFGVLDLAGNVVEWVNDIFDARYYAEAPPANPPGPASGGERVLRGGAFGNPDGTAYTTTHRYHLPESKTDVDVGFRCAKAVQ